MIAEQYHDEKERLKAMALIENSEYDVTLSIVSHNSRRDLQGLMPSVSKACGDVSHEIIVVDNRSTDGSARYISEKHSYVKLLKNKARKGYGANHNQSIAIARGRYTALMNADLVLTPGSIARLVEYMDMNPDTGMVSGNFVFPDGTPQYLNKRLPAVADLFIRRFLPSKIQQKKIFAGRIAKYEMRDTGYSDFADVPFLSGAFLFARTEALKAVNGFDERFFLYFEDVDLCRRISEKWRTVFHPDIRIVHRWHRAAHNELKWALVFIRSAFLYFNKWGYRFF